MYKYTYLCTHIHIYTYIYIYTHILGPRAGWDPDPGQVGPGPGGTLASGTRAGRDPGQWDPGKWDPGQWAPGRVGPGPRPGGTRAGWDPGQWDPGLAMLCDLFLSRETCLATQVLVVGRLTHFINEATSFNNRSKQQCNLNAIDFL